MGLREFRNFKRCAAIALALSTATASPIADAGTSFDTSHVQERSVPDVILTTTTPSGQVIDWIPIESQGNVVLPPSDLFKSNIPFTGTGKGAESELLLPGVTLGPPGTVPVPRKYKGYTPPLKKAPPIVGSSKAKRDLERRDGYGGAHWYVNSGMGVTNYGSLASYSLFKPYQQSGTCDFSLIQTACAQTNAATPNQPGKTSLQTVEAGWINFPCQVSQPHVFTYYNINGYQTQGDYLGGWNTDYKGWVQISQTYYPGVVLTPTSVIGGNQSEIQLIWEYYQSNWYLAIQTASSGGSNIVMGYYPGSLFSNNTANGTTTLANGTTTLANGSNYVAFFGEIEQFESNITATDMGSGNFGTAGYNQSAYFHNMNYLDTTYTARGYTAGFGDTNTSLWNHGNGPAGGSNWGNYIYLGGSGAGLVVGS